MTQTKKSSNKGLGCLIGFLIVAIMISGALNVILMVVAAGKSGGGLAMSRDTYPALENMSEIIVDPGTAPRDDSKIAMIELEGLISAGTPGPFSDDMMQDMIMLLRHATDDSDVVAIVLYINSPGGEVTASDTIYNEVRKAREKKPVVVYMGPIAASGGYYIACGGTYLMAHETTFTGSIGVIIQSLKYKELFEKVGLEARTFKSGRYKDMLSGTREMTDAEREYVQGLVMQTYDKFLDVVATERQLNADGLRSSVADGRIVSGQDAVKHDLIDSVGYREDAFQQARKLSTVSGAKVVKYQADFNLARALGLASGPAPSRGNAEINVNLHDAIRPPLQPGLPYYLPQEWVD
jgi:protease-4